MKIKSVLKPLCLVFFILMAFSGIAFAGQNNNLIGELSKVDAFHPPENSSLMSLYNEWHYFNLIDEKQNLSAICSFKLDGSLNASQILLVYNIDNSSGIIFSNYPMKIANYSSQTPNITIANSTVRLTPEGYSVHIESDNGSTNFNALFKPEVEPSPLLNTTGFSPLSGEFINWIVASSKMSVSGNLSANGKTYSLENSRGYHDHNWGYWYWGDNFGWDWGQVTQTNDCLNGSSIGKYTLNFWNVTDADHNTSLNSGLNVWKDKKRIVTFKDIKIEHSNFAYVNQSIPISYIGNSMPAGSFPLPLNTKINASLDAGNYLNIEFVTQPQYSDPLMVPVPMIDAYGNSTKDEDGNIAFQYRMIWEMIGTYRVNGKIDGENISYTSNGFMEYVSGNSVSPVSPLRNGLYSIEV